MVRERHHNAAEHRKELAQAINDGSGLTRGTSQTATGSEETIDFTIPSGTDQVILCMYGVSTNAGSGGVIVQAGDGAGGFLGATEYDGVTTRYSGTAVVVGSSTDRLDVLYTAGWQGTDVAQGTLFLHRIDGNKWVASSNMFADGSAHHTVHTNRFECDSGELDAIRITTVNGSTYTFDSGSIFNIFTQ